jgi:hypothetical protein
LPAAFDLARPVTVFGDHRDERLRRFDGAFFDDGRHGQ